MNNNEQNVKHRQLIPVDNIKGSPTEIALHVFCQKQKTDERKNAGTLYIFCQAQR